MQASRWLRLTPMMSVWTSGLPYPTCPSPTAPVPASSSRIAFMSSAVSRQAVPPPPWRPSPLNNTPRWLPPPPPAPPSHIILERCVTARCGWCTAGRPPSPHLTSLSSYSPPRVSYIVMYISYLSAVNLCCRYPGSPMNHDCHFYGEHLLFKSSSFRPRLYFTCVTLNGWSFSRSTKVHMIYYDRLTVWRFFWCSKDCGTGKPARWTSWADSFLVMISWHASVCFHLFVLPFQHQGL